MGQPEDEDHGHGHGAQRHARSGGPWLALGLVGACAGMVGMARRAKGHIDGEVVRRGRRMAEAVAGERARSLVRKDMIEANQRALKMAPRTRARLSLLAGSSGGPSAAASAAQLEIDPTAWKKRLDALRKEAAHGGAGSSRVGGLEDRLGQLLEQQEGSSEYQEGEWAFSETPSFEERTLNPRVVESFAVLGLVGRHVKAGSISGSDYSDYSLFTAADTHAAYQAHRLVLESERDPPNEQEVQEVEAAHEFLAQHFFREGASIPHEAPMDENVDAEGTEEGSAVAETSMELTDKEKKLRRAKLLRAATQAKNGDPSMKKW